MGARVTIIDRDLPRLELEAQSRLLFSSSNWWDRLPVFRNLTDFTTYTAANIFQEKQLLMQYFMNLGYRDVQIHEVVSEYQGRGLQKGPRDKRSVVVNYSVQLGEIWTVSTISISGLNSGTVLSSVPTAPVHFSSRLQTDIHQEVLEILAQEGYAHPRLSWEITEKEGQELEFSLLVEPQQSFTFGRIEFQTWDGRRHRPFLQEYQWSGRRYEPKKLTLLQNKLLSLSLYEKVEIQELRYPDLATIDVLVRLQPVAKWRLSPVILVSSESTTWSLDAGIRWRWRTEILSLSGRHQVGYRNYPQLQFMDFSHQGLATRQEVELARPIFSSLTGEWFVHAEGIAESQIGYQETLLNGSIGLRWKPSSRWSLASAFAWQQHNFLSMVGKEELFGRWFGEQGFAEDVEQPSLTVGLEYLRPKLLWMEFALTPVAWCNGSRLSSYLFRMEARSAHGRWTIRPRLQQGAVLWYDQPVDSLHNRFFLGGSQTVRGWIYRGLKSPDDQSQNFDLARGGERMGMASLELQHQVVPSISILGFFDVGRVWERTEDGRDEWNNFPEFLPSAGFGASVTSPAGDLTLAPAWQLKDSKLKYAPPKMVFHVYVTQELGD